MPEICGTEFGFRESRFFSSCCANPCILPKHLLAKYPNINNVPYNSLPVGIGPFKYTQWKRSDYVEMVANPTYFRGRPKLDKVVFQIIPDRNTVLNELQSHEIDLWASISAGYYGRVSAIAGLHVLKQPGYYFGHVDLNTSHPVLQDPRGHLGILEVPAHDGRPADDDRTHVPRRQPSSPLVRDDQ